MDVPGYGTLCVDCHYEKTIAHFLHPDTVRANGYVSSEEYVRDGQNTGKTYRRLTTWYGGHLAWVWSFRPTRMWSMLDGRLYTLRATDACGHEWVGRGRSGLYVNVRRIKKPTCGRGFPEKGFTEIKKHGR